MELKPDILKYTPPANSFSDDARHFVADEPLLTAIQTAVSRCC